MRLIITKLISYMILESSLSALAFKPHVQQFPLHERVNTIRILVVADNKSDRLFLLRESAERIFQQSTINTTYSSSR